MARLPFQPFRLQRSDWANRRSVGRVRCGDGSSSFGQPKRRRRLSRFAVRFQQDVENSHTYQADNWENGREVSERYHRRRASFLELASTLMTLTILIGGAGAFLSLLGDGTTVAKIATFVVAIVGTMQALFRVDTCAAQHRQWLKRWGRLLTNIRIDENLKPATLATWITERYEIEGECVQEMRALINDCYNRTARALSRDFVPYRIRWWHRAFIEVWPFENAFESPDPQESLDQRIPRKWMLFGGAICIAIGAVIASGWPVQPFGLLRHVSIGSIFPDASGEGADFPTNGTVNQ